jgi:hypothetical protein
MQPQGTSSARTLVPVESYRGGGFSAQLLWPGNEPESFTYLIMHTVCMHTRASLPVDNQGSTGLTNYVGNLDTHSVSLCLMFTAKDLLM